MTAWPCGAACARHYSKVFSGGYPTVQTRPASGNSGGMFWQKGRKLRRSATFLAPAGLCSGKWGMSERGSIQSVMLTLLTFLAPHHGQVMDANAPAAALLVMGEGRGSLWPMNSASEHFIRLATAASREPAVHMDLRYGKDAASDPSEVVCPGQKPRSACLPAKPGMARHQKRAPEGALVA